LEWNFKVILLISLHETDILNVTRYHFEVHLQQDFNVILSDRLSETLTLKFAHR